MCYQIILTNQKNETNIYGNYRNYINAVNELRDLVQKGNCGLNEDLKVTFEVRRIIFDDN